MYQVPSCLYGNTKCQFRHSKRAESLEYVKRRSLERVTRFVAALLPIREAPLDGAGDENRTRMTSLEGWGSAIELHPRTVREQWKKSTGYPWAALREALLALRDRDFS